MGEENTPQFRGTGDGYYPYGSLMLDSRGNVYGTTFTGGAHGHGTVFKLSQGIPWSESLLYSFAGGVFDGAGPMSSLVMDSFGNLYGTTSGRGAHGYGFVFELHPGTPWKESLLHTFVGGTEDGIYPNAGLVMDTGGNFYGTTQVGGAHSLGIGFKLSVLASWAETVLHNFAGDTGVHGDGACPYVGDLIMDRSGNLYGTTHIGGTNAVGTVFKIVP